VIVISRYLANLHVWLDLNSPTRNVAFHAAVSLGISMLIQRTSRCGYSRLLEFVPVEVGDIDTVLEFERRRAAREEDQREQLLVRGQ
jgi:hypothetical protein